MHQKADLFWLQEIDQEYRGLVFLRAKYYLQKRLEETAKLAHPIDWNLYIKFHLIYYNAIE